jgi:hypothetical protein
MHDSTIKQAGTSLPKALRYMRPGIFLLGTTNNKCPFGV